ncbi:MAG: hypothetical protein AAB492_04090 [Patescibacteria group bacterium]
MKILKKYNNMIHSYFPSKREVFDVFNKDNVKILYGETYDLLGITIDSLKYYLFVGLFPDSTILIADTASAINQSSGDTQTIFDEGKKRLSHIQEIIQTYHLPIHVTLMSELFKEPHVQELIKQMQDVVIQSPKIQTMLQKTVLQNRIKQEDKSTYKYAVEAIATSLSFDLKVGPPRERFYDEAAQLVAKELKRECYKSIYLTPTYPLGMDFLYFLQHPEIERFGLTPYKAGSNKLQDHRIILGKTSFERTQELIKISFMPKQTGLPDPVGDVENILRLAQHFRKETTYETLF